MKPFVLILLALCSVMLVMAQSSVRGQQIIEKRCGADRVSLSADGYGHSYPALFDTIEVLDARRDTSRIGIIRAGAREQHEVLYHLPVAAQLTGYLNTVYARPNGGHSLLIVLKNLWIDTHIDFLRNEPEWNISFLAEAYLKTKGGYVPLTFTDTTLRAIRSRSIYTLAADRIGELFDMLMSKLAVGDLDKDRRVVSYQQIDSFNRVRFNYPMDTATHLVKGVYKNIKEFRNNAPSIPTYDLAKVDGGNVDLLADSVWGYCDGERSYVRMPTGVFPIFSVDHQFYALGAKALHYYENKLPVFIPLPGVVLIRSVPISGQVTTDLRIYRVNIKTGKLTE
jgi:hypothetical protein